MTIDTRRNPKEIGPTGSEFPGGPNGGESLCGSGLTAAADLSASIDPLRPAGSGFGRYLHSFRRQWPAAVALGLFCGVVAAIAAWLQTAERHTAVAVLRISANDKQLVFPTPDRAAANDFEIYKGTQQQLLTSDVVMIAALHRPEVADLATVRKEEDPVRWLARNVRVELPPNSEIMRVSLTTSQPDEAANLVGAVVDSYISAVVDAQRRRQQDRLNHLDGLYAEKESEMRTRRTELKQLAERLGTVETAALALKQQIAVQQYAEARNELSRLRSELQRASDDLQGRQAWLKVVQSAPTPDPDLLAASDPTLTRLSERIEEIDARLAAIRGKLKEPVLSKVSADYSQERKTLVQKCERREKALGAKLQKAMRDNQDPQIVELRSRIDLLKDQEKAAAENLERQRLKAEQFGNSSIDVEMMRTELQYLDKVLAPIADERERLKVELRSTPPITVFQRAEPPKTPDGRHRLQNAAAAGIGGSLAAIFLVLSWDARKQRVNSLADLSQRLGLTVVGALPRPKESFDSGRPGLNNRKTQDSLDRAVDSIAARLFLRKETEGVRVVMVSSATRGEGKTALAVQLARRLACSGKATLLVDYDLRNPSIHRIFAIPRGPGVSDCLQNHCDLSQVVHSTEAENLAVVTAGDSYLESPAPLANGAATSFFEKARASFACVIVDGSPILPVIDGLLVSQHADTVVLSVWRDRSREPQLLRACEKLTDFGSPKHVVVLGGSREEVGGDDQDRVLPPPAAAVDTGPAGIWDMS